MTIKMMMIVIIMIIIIVMHFSVGVATRKPGEAKSSRVQSSPYMDIHGNALIIRDVSKGGECRIQWLDIWLEKRLG